jgi:hypothetical protein
VNGVNSNRNRKYTAAAVRYLSLGFIVKLYAS